VSVDFPQDSPVMLVSVDCNRSKAIARGSDMIVDLHALLTLRNMDARRFRGVTLLFVAAEASLGGKASAMSSCLNIAQGETFSVSIDLRLIRPVQEQVSKDVRVYLDGVLFDNLQFYGPDRTGSADATGTRGAEAADSISGACWRAPASMDSRSRSLLPFSCPSNRTQAGQRVIRGRAAKYEPECAARRGLSDEEERLLEIYRKRGIEPLVEELKKF
jgi:hypothetical protein